MPSAQLTPADLDAIEASIISIEATLLRGDHYPKTEKSLFELQRMVMLERHRINEKSERLARARILVRGSGRM